MKDGLNISLDTAKGLVKQLNQEVIPVLLSSENGKLRFAI